MRSKKELLKKARLYLVVDREVQDYSKLFEIARKAISAGVDIIQLRDKHGSAKDILEFSKGIRKLSSRVLYIINDRVDLALIAQADGVHLGQEDIPLKEARKLMGKKVLIGISCQSLPQALKAQREGADYIGFGSVFKTLTKPERQLMDLEFLQRIIKKIHIPLFAIGGITAANMIELKNLGVERFAVCRAICQARDVKKVIKKFKAISFKP